MAKNLILWLVIAVVLMMVFQNISGSENTTNKLAYSTFLEQVKRGDIKEVTIDQSTNEIRGVRNNNDTFITQIPYLDMKLMDELLSDGNVIVSGKKPEEQSFLASILINWFPMLLLIGVWIFFMRKMQGGGGGGAMSFGKSKAKLLGEDQIKTTFADVAGCDEAKEDVSELVDFLRDPTK
ncbi:MAG: cell division protease FtsH, partial [Glaciecola sp.]